MIILVAIDLSAASVDAARTAVALARGLGDELLFLHATDPAAPLDGTPAPDRHAANLEALRNLRASLDADDIGIELRVVEGAPFDALVACAAQAKPRLLVMGAHGRNAVARLLFGSVTYKILLASPCPVLVCRAGASPFAAWTGERRPLRIVAGVDRGATGATIVAWLQAMRGAGPAQITLLHEYWPARERARLGDGNTRQNGGGETESQDIGAALARELSEDLRAHGVTDAIPLRVCPVQGPVSEQLAIDAEANAADLLVITAPQHDGKGPPPTAWGSVAAATMSATRVPLLVIPVG